MLRRFVLPLLIAGVVARPAFAQAAHPVMVVTDSGTRSLDAADLARLPRDTARMTFHGQPPMLYEGPSLSSVLRSAGVRTDLLRGPDLSTRIVVEASDGYRIVLALADLDPGLGSRRMILADRVDGQLLSADEGPRRLIIADDARPSRSARQVVPIKVLSEPR